METASEFLFTCNHNWNVIAVHPMPTFVHFHQNFSAKKGEIILIGQI